MQPQTESADTTQIPPITSTEATASKTIIFFSYGLNILLLSYALIASLLLFGWCSYWRCLNAGSFAGIGFLLVVAAIAIINLLASRKGKYRRSAIIAFVIVGLHILLPPFAVSVLRMLIQSGVIQR
jgi:ABC-type transport system involved in cytochrome c biogenesis permease subunit